MLNDYEVRGNDVVIFIESKKHGKYETIISKKQLQRAMELPNSWRVQKHVKRNVLYIVGSYTLNGKKKRVYLHRWLTHAPKGMMVDHINHDTLDNRFENLRIVTNAENQQNRRGAKRNSTTGIRGVYWEKRIGKWKAHYMLNGKRVIVGFFEDIKEAEKAVIEARRLSMPFSQENAENRAREAL